ncbi:hypothetical protein [Rheinheimera oceanensis]|uniref:hypothetical protein n=1 Tax=Rheinheimera oceanensis TaxID=2817449 RepID=UPI001BFECADE|nr:hypothetical protein [Rheinheimera oceanensis]
MSSRSRLNELRALAHSGRRSPSQVEGNRWDVSANITLGAGASGGASVGYGETEGSSAWVNEQSSIIGSGSVNIRTEGHTQIDGAVIANIDENGNDLGNLTLDTGSLAYSDIADHDKEKSYYLNVGFTMGDDTRKRGPQKKGSRKRGRRQLEVGLANPLCFSDLHKR